ncbi:hypothetical protein [Colwellia piezophila]|uniref:hypothetical protein n=1 Tax=Colwellia piezophila TaxID=211668 RepID=UPI000360B2C4|nr:hypothetical protein [Colwellia piezophila]
MKSLSVIFILSVALILIAKGQVYFGFVVLLFTFFTVIKLAASSPYGDFSKTAEEIKAIIQSRKKVDVDIDYLSYPEQVAMKEQQRQQGFRVRARERAKRKAEAKCVRRVYLPVENNIVSVDDSWDDNTLFSTSISRGLYDDDDFFNNGVISDSDIFDGIKINPNSGLVLLGNSLIDVGGNCIGQSDWDNNPHDDGFSSLDDICSSSFEDINDCLINSMDEW